MSADTKAPAPAPASNSTPTQPASEETTPVASTSSIKDDQPVPTASEAATAAASSAADAATAAGTAVQTAANNALGRAQQHGFYQGNFEEEVGQVVKSLGSFWGGFKARVSERTGRS